MTARRDPGSQNGITLVKVVRDLRSRQNEEQARIHSGSLDWSATIPRNRSGSSLSIWSARVLTNVGESSNPSI